MYILHKPASEVRRGDVIRQKGLDWQVGKVEEVTVGLRWTVTGLGPGPQPEITIVVSANELVEVRVA